jgi:hypothetical protein
MAYLQIYMHSIGLLYMINDYGAGNYSAHALADAAGHDDAVRALRGHAEGSERGPASIFGVLGAAICACAAAYARRLS